VSQIFAEKGEAEFRDIERRMLHEAGEFENVVISTGGGTPCFFDNIDYMNRQGITVFLEASVDVIFTRLTIARTQRPLVAGKSPDELRAYIRQMLELRMPYYRQAAHTFCADQLENIHQVNRSVEQFKKEIL
jgi:shikimate kinase